MQGFVAAKNPISSTNARKSAGDRAEETRNLRKPVPVFAPSKGKVQDVNNTSGRATVAPQNRHVSIKANQNQRRSTNTSAYSDVSSMISDMQSQTGVRDLRHDEIVPQRGSSQFVHATNNHVPQSHPDQVEGNEFEDSDHEQNDQNDQNTSESEGESEEEEEDADERHEVDESDPRHALRQNGNPDRVRSDIDMPAHVYGSRLPHSVFSGTGSYPATTSGRMSSVDDNQDVHKSSHFNALQHPQPQIVQHEIGGPGPTVAQIAALTHLQDMNKEYQRSKQQRQTSKQTQSTKRKVQQQDDTHWVSNGQTIRVRTPDIQQPIAAPYPRAALPNHSAGQQTIGSMVPPNRSELVPQNAVKDGFVPMHANQVNQLNLSTRPAHRAEPQVFENSMDYDTPTLNKMSFDELCKEPFDAPHQKTIFADPAVQGSTLADRLGFLTSCDPENQAQFLGMLSTKEWEEAGIWFTGQFSVLMQRMQTSRQERRKIAESFEDEVKRRHENVNKEGVNLEEALKGMKRSGGMVLEQSTPKRSQGNPRKK